MHGLSDAVLRVGVIASTRRAVYGLSLRTLLAAG